MIDRSDFQDEYSPYGYRKSDRDRRNPSAHLMIAFGIWPMQVQDHGWNGHMLKAGGDRVADYDDRVGSLCGS